METKKDKALHAANEIMKKKWCNMIILDGYVYTYKNGKVYKQPLDFKKENTFLNRLKVAWSIIIGKL